LAIEVTRKFGLRFESGPWSDPGRTGHLSPQSDHFFVSASSLRKV
jgi:hypothetical protein